MNKEELQEILENHLKWLNDQDGGKRANLCGASLQGADLQGANLWGANLRGASLQGANLRGARLCGATGIQLACPEEGAFIGWKKAYKNQTEYLVKLKIPQDAKRSSATGRKCRCDKAEVLETYTMDGKIFEEAVYSGRDNHFLYEKGKTVSVDNFEECRWLECAPGIHFFITKQEAIDY